MPNDDFNLIRSKKNQYETTSTQLISYRENIGKSKNFLGQLNILNKFLKTFAGSVPFSKNSINYISIY